MTAVALAPWAAPAAASQRAEPREIGLLVASVVARALRRLSWLATVETNVMAGDTPEAELHWQRENEAGRTMSAAVDLADSTLAELVDGRFAGLCRQFGSRTPMGSCPVGSKGIQHPVIR